MNSFYPIVIGIANSTIFRDPNRASEHEAMHELSFTFLLICITFPATLFSCQIDVFGGKNAVYLLQLPECDVTDRFIYIDDHYRLTTYLSTNFSSYLHH